ncbi:MAG: ABC transporter permease subunit, partial [Pseudomonadota bacterium]|nr:ABC transporter permease subunit [Pseudomonadota bacterium]
MIEFSNWDILRNLLIATQWTVLLSLAAFIGGTAVALGLTAIRLTRNPVMMRIVKLYIELFQGTPLLMQMFLCFFGLSMIGFMTGVVAALGCVSALLARPSQGGRDVDISLFDVALHQLTYPGTWYLNHG